MESDSENKGPLFRGPFLFDCVVRDAAEGAFVCGGWQPRSICEFVGWCGDTKSLFIEAGCWGGES